MVNSPHFRGYNRVASELTRGQPDWREQIDIGAERPALARDANSPAWARLRGPNQWPAAAAGAASGGHPMAGRSPAGAHPATARTRTGQSLGQAARRAREPLYGEMTRTTLVETHPLSRGLRRRRRRPNRECAGDRECARWALTPLGQPSHRARWVSTPARGWGSHGARGWGGTLLKLGVGAHKDSELLGSLLLQDDQGGLQVETAQGWIDVPPRSGTFVINIGELLELTSDGYLRATMHRVVTPPAGVERLSAAFFLGARLDATVPLLPLPPALAAQARGPERDPNNPLFREVGQNYMKGRLRSHPDVARRHHADPIEL